MNFEKAVEIILEHEGGYVNHPNDPGSETKFGISKNSYPNLSIKDLTRNQAIQIYKNDFWDKLKIAEMPTFIRLLYFDCAVNQGSGRAASIWKLTNQIKDGSLISEFAKQRMNHYAGLSTFKIFGAGWSKRLLDITCKSFEDEYE